MAGLAAPAGREESPAAAAMGVVRWSAIAAGVVVFLGMWSVLADHTALYDTDAYFHLAVARRYFEEGLGGGLPWARFSVMHEGFGDKELLFHLVLAPLGALFGPAGGRFMLALFNGVLGAAVARLAAQAVGGWGVLASIGIYFCSYDYLDRMLRLRPEMLLLLWLLLAVELAARGRHLALAGVAFLLTWSHTGFPILLFLCAAWLLADVLFAGRSDWRLVLFPGVGMALALALHPHSPHHLIVWWTQNVEHFRLALPDQGGEFAHNTLLGALTGNGAWFLGLAGLLALGHGAPANPPATHTPLARCLIVAAFVFGALFAYLSRFATLFVPFATLAALHGLRGPGGTSPERRLRLRWPGLLLLVGSLALAARTPRLMEATLDGAGLHFGGFEPQGRQFGRLVPRGAKVAAPVGDAQFYTYFAPWGRYLNVLDPAFMAVRFPTEYGTFLDVFGGREPDVPLAVATVLDSDHVALFGASKHVVGLRLAADPRVLRHDVGSDSLFTLRDGGTGFVLDWRLPPASSAPAPALRMDPRWPAYPRAGQGRHRAIEGYVDLRRTGDTEACRLLVHESSLAAPANVVYEFAPYGAGELWLDGRSILALAGARQAILGQGAVLPLPLSAGTHTLAVRSCPAGGHNGFYLLERSRKRGDG